MSDSPITSGMTGKTFRVGDFLLKEWEPGEEERIVAAFNRVFAKADPNFRPRSLDFWRWQYLDNPSGKLLIHAEAPDGSVAAHHGFINQRLLLEGRPSLCGQMVDSMVDPAYRRGLQRVSLSATLSNSFIGHTGGEGARLHAFYWGAPVPVAMRIGKALVQYEVVRTQLKLSCAPAEVRLQGASGISVEEPASFPEDTVEFFRKVAHCYKAIAVRDQPQLDWRFVRHPECRFSIATARLGGELRGYAVYSHGSFDGFEEGLVCDWLVHPDDGAAANALWAWLVEKARASSAERLTAVFPETVPDWIRFQEAGFRAAPTQYPFVARTCVRRFDPPWLRRNWYYTLGDTDLV